MKKHGPAPWGRKIEGSGRIVDMAVSGRRGLPLKMGSSTRGAMARFGNESFTKWMRTKPFGSASIESRTGRAHGSNTAPGSVEVSLSPGRMRRAGRSSFDFAALRSGRTGGDFHGADERSHKSLTPGANGHPGTRGPVQECRDGSVVGQDTLDAPVRDQPGQRDQHVDGQGNPVLDEGQRDRDRIQRGRCDAFAIPADRARDQ